MNHPDESLSTGLPPFRRLQRTQIREILDRTVPKRIEPGTEMFHEGHDAERFYLELAACIRVIKATPGGDQIIALLISPGQLCGIAPALSRTSYPATAAAAAESLTRS